MAESQFTQKRLVHVTGLDLVTERLRALKEEVRSKVVADAVKRAAKPMLASMRRHAANSVRTGALRASLGSKVIEYKKDGTAVAIVGVRRGYWKGSKKVGKKGDRRGSESPSHYAHLVEWGHHAVTGGSLRGQYEKVLKRTGRLTKSGKPVRRWTRGRLIKAASGKKVGWVSAKPFIRPAFYDTRAAVTRELILGIAEGIQRATKRQAA